MGMVTLLSVAGTEITASTPKTQTLTIKAGRGAPHAVATAFNQVVTDIMNTNFTGSGWDDSNIDWTKDQRVWTATGRISLPGNDAYGLQIHAASFEQNGELIEITYTVLMAE
jgi:hypothetical protein